MGLSPRNARLKLFRSCVDEYGVTSSISDDGRAGRVQLPASGPYGQKRTLNCEVDRMEGKRLILSTSESIQESTVVSVEYEDTLFLGEVVTCSGGPQGWRVEVRVDQILTGLQSLMTLRAHLLTESVSAALPLVPVGARN